jgi:hypothetical protein
LQQLRPTSPLLRPQTASMWTAIRQSVSSREVYCRHPHASSPLQRSQRDKLSGTAPSAMLSHILVGKDLPHHILRYCQLGLRRSAHPVAMYSRKHAMYVVLEDRARRIYRIMFAPPLITISTAAARAVFLALSAGTASLAHCTTAVCGS